MPYSADIAAQTPPTFTAMQPSLNANPASRRILLCAIGMSPQIVTETLYALAVNPAPGVAPWVPAEVRIITTAQGAQNARLTLLSGRPGWFHQLLRDYDLPDIRFDDEHIHVIRGPGGAELDDIRSLEDNDAAADLIATLVRDLTVDENVQLHASLAGGRKTMSYYLGYALALFGRAQDRLSHVLVSSDYESHPEFFYPTPYERVIHTREVQPRALDCRDATVRLAEIPFLSLRDTQPAQALRAGSVRLRDAMRLANLAMHPAIAEIDPVSGQIRISGESAPLTDTQYAFYAWMLRRHKDGLEEFDASSLDDAQHFLDDIRRHYSEMDKLRQRMEDTLGQSIRRGDKEGIKSTFAPIKTRTNNSLVEALGQSLARRCQIESRGARNGMRYGLPADLDVR